MEPTAYRHEWHKLRESKVDPRALGHLARQIAFSFIDRQFQRGLYEPAYIDLLCEMATFYSKGELSHIASAALYDLVVERLCDDFEDLPLSAYSRAICQVIAYCRGVPAGHGLDETLNTFGMLSSDHLYQRALSTRTRQYRYDVSKPPRRIVLLSRGTIGADVAILSVMIQRLTKLFDETEIVVLGNAKLHELFDAHPRVRVGELNHARRDGLFERFASWHAALKALRDEMPPGGETEMLVIDPDAQISQLGMLPLVHADNYLFFPTRDHTLTGQGHRMGERVNDWMDVVFGTVDFCYPTVWVSPSIMDTARIRTDLLRAAGAKQVITVDLGVGHNARKRVNLEFERRLLRALAVVPDTVVILNRGFGPDETGRSMQLVADIRSSGLPSLETHLGSASFPAIPHGVVTVECHLGEMAALIAHSDEYIGYNSAGQHIAAAAKIPTLTVFAGSNNMNFVQRWSAFGDTECRIVHVNTLTDPGHVDIDEIISRIMQARTDHTLKGSRQRIHEIHREQRRSKPTRERVSE